jgi:hypothetical protein
MLCCTMATRYNWGNRRNVTPSGTTFGIESVRPNFLQGTISRDASKTKFSQISAESEPRYGHMPRKRLRPIGEPHLLLRWQAVSPC